MSDESTKLKAVARIVESSCRSANERVTRFLTRVNEASDNAQDGVGCCQIVEDFAFDYLVAAHTLRIGHRLFEAAFEHSEVSSSVSLFQDMVRNIEQEIVVSRPWSANSTSLMHNLSRLAYADAMAEVLRLCRTGLEILESKSDVIKESA